MRRQFEVVFKALSNALNKTFISLVLFLFDYSFCYFLSEALLSCVEHHTFSINGSFYSFWTISKTYLYFYVYFFVCLYQNFYFILFVWTISKFKYNRGSKEVSISKYFLAWPKIEKHSVIIRYLLPVNNAMVIVLSLWK